MAVDPATGLELVEDLTGEPLLKNYYLLPSVRGDLLEKLGRHEEAGAEFKRTAALTRNARERDLLLARARACLAPPPASAGRRRGFAERTLRAAAATGSCKRPAPGGG